MSMPRPLRIPLPAPTSAAMPSTADAAGLAATRERAEAFAREQEARSLGITSAVGAQDKETVEREAYRAKLIAATYAEDEQAVNEGVRGALEGLLIVGAIIVLMGPRPRARRAA